LLDTCIGFVILYAATVGVL